MLRKFTFNTSLKVFGFILLTLIGLITSNRLGSQLFFEYTVVLRWFTLFGILSIYGGDSELIRFTGSQNNPTIARLKFEEYLSVSIHISFLLLVIVLVSRSLFDSQVVEYILLGGILTIPFNAIKLGASYMNGLNKISKSLVISDISSPFLSIILILLFLEKIKSISILIGIIFIARLIVALFVVYILKVKIRFFNFKTILNKIYSQRNNFFNLSIGVFNTINTSIILFLADNLFPKNIHDNLALGVKLGLIVLVPMQMFNIINAPFIAKSNKTSNFKSIKNRLKKTFFFNTCICLIGIFIFLLFQKEIISLWGVEFIENVEIITLTVLGYIAFSVGLHFDMTYIMTGNNKSGFKLNLIFLLANLLSLLIVNVFVDESKIKILIYFAIVGIFQLVKWYNVHSLLKK